VCREQHASVDVGSVWGDEGVVLKRIDDIIVLSDKEIGESVEVVVVDASESLLIEEGGKPCRGWQ
jgi:hypothetical protein